jgi:hypothetical protein
MTAAATASSSTTEAPIVSVCVYRNGALVRRRAHDVQPGSVELGGLPLLFVADSLRVQPEAGQITGLEEGCRLSSDGMGREAAAEKLAEVSLDILALSDRLRSAKALIGLLTGLEPSSFDEERLDTPDVRTWLSVRRFADARVEALAEEIDDLTQEMIRLRREQTQLKRLARGDTDPARALRSVRFSLEGTDQPCAVSIEYFVPAARWVPTYTLTTDGDQAELKMHAYVAQATGEDWRDVTLRLCTADLDRASTLPELGSWRIGRAQPESRRAYRPLPDDGATLFVAWDDHKRRAGGPPTPRLPEPRGGPGGQGPAEDRRRDTEDDDDGFDADLSTGGRAAMYASFEEEGTGEYDLSEMMPLDADSDTTGGFQRAEVSSVAEGMAPGAPPAELAVSAVMAMDMLADAPAMARKRKAGPPMPAAARSGGGGAPPPPVQAPVPAAPRPRPRYAWYRLRGPDEEMRGELWPVDPLEHLHALLDDREVFDLEALRRARAALERAARRLERTPLPPRCVALSGRSIPHGFEAPGSHVLPGDGRFHHLNVGRESAPASTRLVAVPLVSDDVYRVLTFAHDASRPHPAGPMQVYVDGAFRAEGLLEGSTREGGGLELSLGVEPAVRIASRTVHVDQAEKGLVSQTSRIDHRVEIQVQSGLSTPARVHVYERLPIADTNEKEIDVTLVSGAPSVAKAAVGPDGGKLEGGLRLDVDVAPSSIATATLHYQIKLPAKAELIGGNRRD